MMTKLEVLPFILLLKTAVFGVLGQLIVNVENKGGEVMVETIEANTTQDIISLSYQKPDGTKVTQFIDFKNEIQLFQIEVLGEEELGQSGSQTLCFLTRLGKNEFISSDAMSKLRQKNAGAVRHPEEDKPTEELSMDLIVNLDQSGVISPHVREICRAAPDTTFTRDTDLSATSHAFSKDYTTLLGATKRVSLQRVQPCGSLTEGWRPCLCRYHLCVHWYPCGLKYCKGKDSAGKTVSYRCGIKTCGKCRVFEFYSRRRELCMWNLSNIGTFAKKETKEEHVEEELEEEEEEERQDGVDEEVDPQVDSEHVEGEEREEENGNMDREYDPETM